MQYTSHETYELISQQTNDPIIEWKVCTVSWTKFPIYQSDLDFYTKISPVFASEKFQIPTPTLCPEERLRRRLTFRNERSLYKRNCDASGKPIVSMYKPSPVGEGGEAGWGYKVYDQAIYYSDQRDPLSYGQDFDITKTFTEQYQQLMHAVPKINLSNDNVSINSLYVNQTTHLKDCYLIFDADVDDSCMYANAIKYCNHCLDCTNIYNSDLCYEWVNCTKCYNCKRCTECEYSTNLTACLRCKNCQDCFACINLINKQYCIRNIQYSKQEYDQLIQKEYNLLIGTRQQSWWYLDQLNQWFDTHQQRANYTITSEWCIGNNIAHSTDSILCYNMWDCKDCKYSWLLNNSRSSYDHNIWWINCELIYEWITVGENAYHCLFNIECWDNIANIYYCHYCMGCQNCFGCCSLINKQYCIFNKQYTKEEYEIQVAKIIQHMMTTWEWWEFFHPSLSPYGYNETIAQEYYPLSTNLVIAPIEDRNKLGNGATEGSAFGTIQWEIDYKKYWYTRSDYNADPVIPAWADIIQWSQLGHDISQTQDSILTKIIICAESARPFKIQKAELEYYRKHNIPLPIYHPDIRNQHRRKRKPHNHLQVITSASGDKILSVHTNDSHNIISEKEYNQLINW